MWTVITQATAMEMEKSIQNAINNRVELWAGHKREGALFASTVLDHLKDDHAIVPKETFGPKRQSSVSQHLTKLFKLLTFKISNIGQID